MTKYLRSIGAYNAITDDQCVLVKEFMEQCTLHSNRAITNFAHCVQKMLHWCYIINEDGSHQVPALKKGEPPDILILFNEKNNN